MPISQEQPEPQSQPEPQLHADPPTSIPFGGSPAAEAAEAQSQKAADAGKTADDITKDLMKSMEASMTKYADALKNTFNEVKYGKKKPPEKEGETNG
jgi:hypothetical protein